MFIDQPCTLRTCAPAERDVSGNGIRGLDEVSLRWSEEDPFERALSINIASLWDAETGAFYKHRVPMGRN